MVQLQSAYKNQRDQIEHLEAFISRFRYQATKAKQVQSRIKELEKIERIEIPEEEPVIHFSFPQPPVSGRTVVECVGLSKSYGPKNVLNDVSFTIEREDRIALVGVNGAGKSTLVRLLSGEDTPTSGLLKMGHNVVADYFAQDQYKVLDPEARMLDDIGRTAPKVSETELRSLLGCFLFSGDDAFKRLGVLSGGERNRYALARILVSPANFLLLDEPTNHLDLRAKDVLLDAINKFTGTVIFVSHDRYFIDRLATRVFEVADGKVHVYPGNYEDYLWRKEGGAETLQAATMAAAAPVIAPVVTAPTNGASSNGSAEKDKAKKVNPIKLKQMQERLAAVEAEMPRVESSIADAEAELGNFVSAEETARVSQQLDALREQQASLSGEWEELMLQLEES
jgi:ATP-binding cassette subfamily F protein 3